MRSVVRVPVARKQPKPKPKPKPTTEQEEPNKSSLLQIRLTDLVREQMATEASAMGVSISAFARMAIIEKIREARAARGA